MTRGVGNSFVTQAGGCDARVGKQFCDASGEVVTQWLGNSFVTQTGIAMQGLGNNFVTQAGGS